MARVKALVLLAATLLVFLVTAVPASATSIAIVNPSFESPSIHGTSPGYSFSVTGWTTDQAGTLWDYCPSCFPTPVDGLQEAFLLAMGSIDQVLNTSLAANTTYTLTVYAGQRYDVPLLTSGSYDIQLLAGGVLLAENGSVLPARGSFLPVTATFTTGSSGAQMGQALEIDLVSNNEESFPVFDAVSLDATSTSSVPEPSSLLLLGTGMLGTLGALRRKVAGP